MSDEIEAVAVRACRAGGQHLREQFGAGRPDAEYHAHDVKAAVDEGSEERMLAEITEAFPDHAVYAEESGEVGGDGRYRWIVDPLDGTNNFVSGLPSFATAVAVLAGEKRVCAAVYVPVLDDLYVARRDCGVRYNGRAVTADGNLRTDHGTVAFVVGHDVKLDADRLATAREMEARLRDRCKRVIESWSPCVHWGLLARGRLDGMVCYRPDVEEQHAGALLAAEAGVPHVERDEWYVGATTKETLDALRSDVGSVVNREV